jgi:hypothetical protein
MSISASCHSTNPTFGQPYGYEYKLHPILLMVLTPALGHPSDHGSRPLIQPSFNPRATTTTQILLIQPSAVPPIANPAQFPQIQSSVNHPATRTAQFSPIQPSAISPAMNVHKFGNIPALGHPSGHEYNPFWQ